MELKHWLQSSLMYWGACFDHPQGASSKDILPCLRCASPAYLKDTPVKDLVLVPDCGHTNPDYSTMTSTITQISQYFAIFILLVSKREITLCVPIKAYIENSKRLFCVTHI